MREFENGKMPTCENARYKNATLRESDNVIRENASLPKCQIAKIGKCENSKLPDCEIAKITIAKLRKCENQKNPIMPNCENAKMEKCDNVKERECENGHREGKRDSASKTRLTLRAAFQIGGRYLWLSESFLEFTVQNVI